MTTATPSIDIDPTAADGKGQLVMVDRTFIWRGTKANKHLPYNAGFRWSADRAYWWSRDFEAAAKLYPYSANAETIAALRDLYETLVRPKVIARQSVAASRATDADVDIPSPEGLEYMPFQRAGIAYANRRFALAGETPTGVLIADEMGLGKTIQAIGIINSDPSIKDVIVVCPASLKINWRRELDKWLVRPMWTYVVEDHFPMGPNCVRIVNYDRLHKFDKVMRSRTWDLVIADEAHYAKNPDARRSIALHTIPARRKIYLSGTPIVNRPLEAFTLVSVLAPDEFADRDEFQREYSYACSAPKNTWGRNKAKRELAALQEKLRSTCMVRRLKKDVLTDLPAKRRQVVELPPGNASGEVAREMAEVEAFIASMFEYRLAVELAKAGESDEAFTTAMDALRDAQSKSMGQIARLRHATALAKVPSVIDFVKEALAQEDKLVLFAHHHDVIDAFKAAFPKESVKLVGGMDSASRQHAVDAFMRDPKTRLFIGGIQAAGVGLTLTAASHVVFAELGWTPAEMSQAEDRCHRIGQKDSVLVQHLVYEGSLDSSMAKTLVDKQRIIDLALDSEKGELSDTPLVPMSESHSSAHVTRVRLGRDAAMITAPICETAHIASRFIEAQGTDVNAIDLALSKNLASQASLTARQAALARLIGRRYASQLPQEIANVLNGRLVLE